MPFVDDPKDAPTVSSLIRHPVVPLPIHAEVVDKSGAVSTLIFSYCHANNGPTMAQFKLIEEGQPTESLCTVASENSCRIEYVYDEQVHSAELSIPEDVQSIDFKIGAEYEPGSFEQTVKDVARQLPRFARFRRFARITPIAVQGRGDEVTLQYADGSEVRYNPKDLYRVGASQEDIILLCLALGPLLCIAIILIILIFVLDNDG